MKSTIIPTQPLFLNVVASYVLTMSPFESNIVKLSDWLINEQTKNIKSNAYKMNEKRLRQKLWYGIVSKYLMISKPWRKVRIDTGQRNWS